jgi:hypothetical protein
MTYVDFVFDKLPDHVPPTFIEVENEDGASINFGNWLVRDDGYAVLRIPVHTALDGATTLSPENVKLSTAGEFAAMWNSRTEEQREKLLNNIQSASEEGYTCFMEDHAGKLAYLRTKPRLNETETNRFAQYPYEAISDSPDMSLDMDMTAKGSLVDAITNALGRL